MPTASKSDREFKLETFLASAGTAWMTKSQTFHSIRRDAPTGLRRLHLLARSFARIASLASLLLVAPVENVLARDVRAEIEKHNASIEETVRRAQV